MFALASTSVGKVVSKTGRGLARVGRSFQGRYGRKEQCMLG